jgi:predicted dehydrogenase
MQVNEQPRCKVAFIGAGYMTREHVRAFSNVPDADIVGIASRTRARAEAVGAEFGIPMVCDSVAELYERTLADLVIVAVPELEVNRVAHETFEHPWTVLIEKPAGYDVADAEAIEAAARERQRKVFVALNRRHYGSTLQVAEGLSAVQGQRLITVLDQEDPAAALHSGRPKLVVDNWMYANSIHMIDFFRIFGRGKISAVEQIIPWSPDHPRYVAARVCFDSGDIGLYEGIWNAPGPWSVSVNTPAKRWEMRPVEKATVQLAGQRSVEPLKEAPWDSQFKPGLRRQAELAVAAARGEPNELPTLSDALDTMRLAQSIYRLGK